MKIFKETQDKTLQDEGNQFKIDIRDALRKVVFSRLELVYGRDWESNIRSIRHKVEGRMLEEDENVDLAEWKDWIEVSDFREIIQNNFSYEEFEEAFTIELGTPVKTRKEKLAWLSMIETSKKKPQPLTRSDVNKLELINRHLQQFIAE